MYRRTTSLTWTRPALEEMLEEMNAAVPTTPLDGLFVVPITAGPLGNLDSLAAEYTLSALGAAGTELTTLTPGPNLPGGPCLEQQIELLAGPAPTEETILGFIVLKGAPPAGVLWAVSEPFGEPVQIAIEGDGLSLDVLLALPSPWPTGVSE